MTAPDPAQNAESVVPFRVPACSRHPRNRWWCRPCQRDVARQFGDVYDAFWRSNQRYNELADRLEAEWESPDHDWRAEASGLAYMICQIRDDYLFAKQSMGCEGDSEILASAILNAYRWVDGPLRTYFESTHIDGTSGE